MARPWLSNLLRTPASDPCSFAAISFADQFDRAALRWWSLDDDVQTLLVLGHNPGWEEIVERLTGMTYVVMKTAHMALLDAPAGGWADAFAREGTWKLNRIVNPRGLLDD